jgi:hypothetical protein
MWTQDTTQDPNHCKYIYLLWSLPTKQNNKWRVNWVECMRNIKNEIIKSLSAFECTLHSRIAFFLVAFFQVPSICGSWNECHHWHYPLYNYSAISNIYFLFHLDIYLPGFLMYRRLTYGIWRRLHCSLPESLPDFLFMPLVWNARDYHHSCYISYKVGQRSWIEKILGNGGACSILLNTGWNL